MTGAVFKTVGRARERAPVGFDSHTPPPPFFHTTIQNHAKLTDDVVLSEENGKDKIEAALVVGTGVWRLEKSNSERGRPVRKCERSEPAHFAKPSFHTLL